MRASTLGLSGALGPDSAAASSQPFSQVRRAGDGMGASSSHVVQAAGSRQACLHQAACLSTSTGMGQVSTGNRSFPFVLQFTNQFELPTTGLGVVP